MTFYETFLAFFRSNAVKLDTILRHWQLLVAKRCAVRTRNGMLILMGDGIKAAKETVVGTIAEPLRLPKARPGFVRSSLSSADTLHLSFF